MIGAAIRRIIKDFVLSLLAIPDCVRAPNCMLATMNWKFFTVVSNVIIGDEDAENAQKG